MRVRRALSCLWRIVMKPIIFTLWVVCACGGLSAQTPSWQPSPGHTQVPIWPGAVPDPQPVAGPEVTTPSSGKEGLIAGRPVVGVFNVTRPTMTVYSPEGKNTGAAVVVFPGGGYQGLAIDFEGTEVCDWRTPKGITCVLLKYRVTDVGEYPKSGPYPESPMALEDAQRTMGLVRFHAVEWHIDPHKMECSGFRQVGICRQRSARILRSVCIQLSMPPTKKAAARTLRWLSIRDICRFPRRNGMPSRAPKSMWSVIRRMLIKSL